MTMTLNQAAKAAGRAKGTILKAIKDGTMSAPKDERGRYMIDGSELNRVFPYLDTDQSPKPQADQPSDHENRLEIERLRAELAGANRLTETLSDQVADLRERLDQEGEERRALTRMLTDHRNTPQEPQKSPSGGVFGFFRRVGA
ncbi:hypothetical protein LVO79_21150 (plasmid) [Roseivivax marinus]|uniref:hypothetical protein n=1 Tax=Roseivivax marinus TaxID=1379903 RepID=UPI001F03A275|nr:hypothetical protein [Roseivivax marinus]UMA67303.1 hypothetical protein LVO79_21150 [Roseivivax marinus]